MNTNWTTQPAFVAYAVAALVLTGNLIFLWMYSGVVRGRTKTTLNEEDARQFGTTLVPTDPAPVAKVLRAYQNAQTSTLPFLVLGLIFVLAGGSATATAWICGVFAVARVLHGIAYLKALQPWRSVFFVLGMAALVALMLAIVVRLVHGG